MTEYLRITEQGELPNIGSLKPFKSVLVIETIVSPDRQALVSKWLVNSGCLYMMAWGHECSAWDTSVNLANLEAFNFGEIPEASFIMTTWHESETLEEVFWFAKTSAFHSMIELESTLILHLGNTDKGEQFRETYRNA